MKKYFFSPPIDKISYRVYNIDITLSRAAEETGPVKPGNLTGDQTRC